MKKIIFKSIAFMGLAAVLTGCSEYAWNEDLKGFVEPDPFTEKTSVSCTLTPADYVKIASYARNKELAEAAGESEALAAIGTNGYFETAEQARKYIPAFLRDSTGTYFVMNNGSTVDVTYDLKANLPEIIKDINAGVSTYTLSEEDYQGVWESDDNYISGFAPMKPASGSLPAILKDQFPQAQAGDYAVVTYNVSQTNPVFGSVEGGEEEWAPTDVLTSNLAEGDEVTVKGWITAIDARGYVLSDNSGSILCYMSGFDASSITIGQQVTLSGAVASYGTGYQFDLTAAEATYGEPGNYTYPTPKFYTGAMMDEAVQRSGNYLCEYVAFDATASVSKYINFIVEGAETAQGSGYQVPDFIKAQLTDGEKYTIYGYFASVSSGKYFNVVITAVEKKASAKPARKAIFNAPATEVSLETRYALYRFDGSKWTVPSNSTVIQPADFTAMGQNYGNFSGNGADVYLPEFLAKNYPYALEDDVMNVVYRYYDGSANSFKASQYVLTDGVWTKNAGQTVDKFCRKDGFWAYNPSVEITLPYSRNTDPSYSYFMSCVDYVLQYVVKPIQPDATTTTAEYYIDYRGNAEFYSGTSAYYGNVDIRPATAKNNAPADAYAGMSDDEIVLLLKKRFSTETLPYALKVHNPAADVVEGMEVTYTVNFTAYNGAASVETIVYDVVGPGQFKYKSSTWVTEDESADW